MKKNIIIGVVVVLIIATAIYFYMKKANFNAEKELVDLKSRFSPDKAKLIKAVDAGGNVTHTYGTFTGKLVNGNKLVWTNKSNPRDVQTWEF